MTPEHALRQLAERYDDGDGEAAALAEEAVRRLAWRRRRGGKVCGGCKAGKPLADFGVDNREADGLHRLCRDCRK